MGRTRFILESVGTRGDIAPLLELGARLRALGHDCRLIAPSAFAAEAAELGLCFHGSTERRENTWGERALHVSDVFFPAYDAVAAAMSDLAGSELPVAVVNIDRACASNLIAEKLGLPTLRLTLCPFKVRSLVEPPWPWGQRAQGPLGKVFLKHTYPRFLDAADHDPRLLDYINGRRRSLGLPAVSTAFHDEPQVCAELALFPDWFAPPASDWPARLELVGFAAGAPAAQLPAPVRAFLEREPCPLVFTTGTGERNVEEFFRAARDCCAALGRAGIFLSSLTPADTGRSGRLLAAAHVELASLLPLASAFIHHGGIGGTARALASSLPQVISPIRFDQPDNARRVQALGVGTVVPRESLSGGALADALRRLEGSCEVRAAVRRVAALAAHQDGLAVCAQVLHERVTEIAARAARERSRARVGKGAGAPAPALLRRTEAGKRGARTIVMIVWPEAGHVAAPLALAQQLRARGERVIFAGLELIRGQIVAQGFEFRALAALQPSSQGIPSSILWSWAGEEPLAPAFQELAGRLGDLLAETRPALVLLDSLYSLLGGMVERRAPWAIFETDLPREADPLVPPPHLNLVPSAAPATRAALRSAWAELLHETAARRANAHPERGGWSLRTRFPDRLRRLIREQTGRGIALHRNTAVAPVAKARRLIFCPRSFDFERSRTTDCFWGDAGIDFDREEPRFDWSLLPAGRRVVYCAQGTQSVRDPEALTVLLHVLRWIAGRPDLTLVLACPAQQQASLERVAPANCILVERAPQLALLRRASAAIVHGGFNTIKECVACAVPMLVVPLSHDQPRNAALVEARGVGLSSCASRLDPAELQASLERLLEEPGFRANAECFSTHFAAAQGSSLRVLDDWLEPPQLARVSIYPARHASRGSPTTRASHQQVTAQK